MGQYNLVTIFATHPLTKSWLVRNILDIRGINLYRTVCIYYNTIRRIEYE